jgi:hypothetical protein
MQVKSVRLDLGGVSIDVGRHVDLVTGPLCGYRHRQAVGNKIPVLGHQIEKDRRPPCLQT